MPSDLLPDIPPLAVPHQVQTGPSDCLAACAAMVLAYRDKLSVVCPLATGT